MTPAGDKEATSLTWFFLRELGPFPLSFIPSMLLLFLPSNLCSPISYPERSSPATRLRILLPLQHKEMMTLPCFCFLHIVSLGDLLFTSSLVSFCCPSLDCRVCKQACLSECPDYVNAQLTTVEWIRELLTRGPISHKLASGHLWVRMNRSLPPWGFLRVNPFKQSHRFSQSARCLRD